MIDFNNFRLITIPRWVQACIVVLLGSTVAVDVLIGIISMTSPDKKDWLPGALTFLGTTLPVIMIGLIFIFKHSGAEALQAKTRYVAVKVIPHCLGYTMFEPGPYVPAELARRNMEARKLTPVQISASTEACDCRYRLLLPASGAPDAATPEREAQRVLYFVLELNVRHVNLNLCVPAELFRQASGVEDPLSPQGFEKWGALFHHTLEGAKEAGYIVRPSLITREFAGVPYLACVLAKPLKEEFLWDAAEQVYFAHDLMIMLRFFYLERPELFLRAELERQSP